MLAVCVTSVSFLLWQDTEFTKANLGVQEKLTGCAALFGPVRRLD